MKHWTSTVSTTLDSTADTLLLSVQQDEDDSWIVSDRATDVYGHGSTLLEALVDYWAALRSTVAVLEGEKLPQRLERQDGIARWLLGLPARSA